MVREFTSEEKQKLSQFRERFSDILKAEAEHPHKTLCDDDYFLIRWLRARSLDLDKAEEMLRNSLKWREENEIEGILDRPEAQVPVKYKRLYPTGVFGEDQEGNVLLCLPVGRFNHRIAIGDIGLEKFITYNHVWLESLVKLVKDKEKELGVRGLQLVEIIDMEQYSFRELTHKPSRDFIVESQKIMEANYPEMLRSMLIINAPKIFAMAFNLVKPILPKETLEKMDIYGGDEEEWKKAIRERGFPLEKIPVRWGGTLKGEDPFCSQDTSVWVDGPLPLSYFTNDEIDQQDLTKTKVGARDKLKLDFHISIKGSELRWRFKTESHDIAFQVNCPENKTPVPWSRLEAHSSLQQGSISCPNVGKYQLVFDNSFSYTKSKTLKYHVEIVEPGDVVILEENENE